MFNELRRVYLTKYRKGNGVRWALACTWEQYRWLRIRRDPKRYAQWMTDHH
jgi:hypothetical protein